MKAEGVANVQLRINEKQFMDEVVVIDDSNDMLVGFSHLSYAKVIKKDGYNRNQQRKRQ